MKKMTDDEVIGAWIAAVLSLALMIIGLSEYYICSQPHHLAAGRGFLGAAAVIWGIANLVLTVGGRTRTTKEVFWGDISLKNISQNGGVAFIYPLLLPLVALWDFVVGPLLKLRPLVAWKRLVIRVQHALSRKNSERQNLEKAAHQKLRQLRKLKQQLERRLDVWADDSLPNAGIQRQRTQVEIDETQQEIERQEAVIAQLAHSAPRDGELVGLQDRVFEQADRLQRSSQELESEVEQRLKSEDEALREIGLKS